MAALAIELATAYVNIVSSARNLGRDIEGQLGAAGDKGGKTAGDKAGKSLTSRLGGVLKKSVIGVGVTAGGLLATSLVKGWGRLTNIENATAKLSGLGNSGKVVQGVMDNALKSVKGTAFGLDEAATTAAAVVAAGIKPGKDLQNVLNTVADTATIAGKSMADTGAIFGSVAARGKLQGDDLLQLTSAGVPVLAMLAKHYKITAAEASQMVSKGKVDFANFNAALHENLGGAALKSGETTQGAFKNMGAAASRFGASLLSGVFPSAKKVFGGITNLLDDAGARLVPFIDAASTRMAGWFSTVGPLAERMWQRVKASPAVQDSLQHLSKIWDTLRDAAVKMWPSVKEIFASLGRATKQLGISSWQVFLGVAQGLASALQRVLVPALKWIADFMRDNPKAVLIAVGAYTTYKVVSMGITTATKLWTAAQKLLNLAMKANPIGLVIAGLAALAAGFMYLWDHSEGFRKFWIGLWNGIKSVVSAVVDWFKGLPATVAAIFTAVINWFKGLPARIWGGVTSGAAWLTTKARDLMGWIWGGIKSAAGAVWDWFRGIPGWIWSRIVTLTTTISGYGGKVIRWIWDGIKAGANAVWDWFRGIGGWIWSRIYGLWSNILSYGRLIIGRIWAGIKAGATAVWNWFSALPGQIWRWIQEKWQDVLNIGSRIAQGIADGIRSAGSAIKNAIQDAVGNPLANSVFNPNRPAGTGGLLGLFGGPRAGGGPVSPGRYYLVGEKGPEIFAPHGPGSIIPNLTPAQPAQQSGGLFTGSLYLDSGQLLGLVRGEIRQDDARQARALLGTR